MEDLYQRLRKKKWLWFGQYLLNFWQSSRKALKDIWLVWKIDKVLEKVHNILTQ